jgi:hypothetical protein
MASSNATLNV